MSKAAAALAALALVACRPAPERVAPEVTAADKVERGAYLAAIMDCTGCHTPGALAGKPQVERALTGSDIGFAIPGMGVFFAPNLTPHPTAGIGGWSEAQIVTAVRTGVRPDGRRLAPIMPWPSYAKLTDADAAALAAYLKSLPPSDRQAPAPTTPAAATAPYLTLVDPRATGAQARLSGTAPATPG